MAYTVGQLISDAFYTSTIVGRQFETIGQDRFADGINLLNEVLTDKTIEESMIPTYSVLYDFNAVVGQEMYFIPELTRCDTLVFFIGGLQGVRYSMYESNRAMYFGAPRANNIQSLPYMWMQERTLGGTNLYMYFFPDQPYIMQLAGLFSVPIVSFNQDMLTTYDPYYVSYLKYRLADKLCILYNMTLPPGASKELERYEQEIAKRSGVMDFRLKHISTLTNRTSINYAQVNIGKAYTTLS